MSIQETLRGIKTLVAVKTIKGTSFVSVRNYENKEGEVSNQTFLVGIDYAKLLKNDFETLKAFDIKPLLADHSKEVVMKAYEELLTSLAKRTASEEDKEELRKANDSTMNRSDAQSDAYVHIAKGLKAQGTDLYVYGLRVKKTVLVEGTYKEVKSQEKTIVKNKIKKLAKLRENDYKQFKLGDAGELRLQGVVI
jgi:hypothetical protein